MKKLLFLLLLAFGAANAQSPDPKIEAAKSRLAMKMKDPESVRFADVVSHESGNSSTVCGWVNAKNSFGAYVGFKPFYVMDTIAEVRDDEEGMFSNHGWFATLWRTCGLLPAGESFGKELVELPKLNSQKECAKRRKASEKPELYANCEQEDADAKAWLQSHTTSGLIALMCGRETRKYGSYSMGKTCVENREANAVIDRGPRTAP